MGDSAQNFGAAGPGSDIAFVNKLYQDLFGRTPDAAGAEFWTNKLQSGEMTAQDVANSFVSSQEAQQNKLSQTDEQRIADAIAAGYTGGTAVSPGDRSEWMQGQLKPDSNDPENRRYYYTDPKTGNVYTSNDENAQLVAKGAVFNDPYISSLNLNPVDARNLYDLKNSNPTQFYDEVAQKLKDQVYEGYRTNSNIQDDYAKLQSLKTVDPQAYYKNQIDFLSNQIGWQIGQNRSDRNAPIEAELKKVATEAQASGLKFEDIKAIVEKGITSANIQNQQRIANEAETGGSGFNFQKDIQPGLVMLALATAAAMSGGAAAPALEGVEAAGAAAGAAGAGAAGAGAAGAASSLPSWLTAAGQGALVGGGMGGINAAVSKGDVLKGILQGGLTGAVGGGVGSALGGGFLGNVAGGALAGGTGSAITGRNIGQGLLMGGAGGALNYGAGQIPGLQGTPGQFGPVDLLRGAITGGALTSAMGGDPLRGALSGAASAYGTNALGNVYNNYFGDQSGGAGYQNINPATGLPNTGSVYVGDGGYKIYPPSSDADGQPGGFYGEYRPSSSYDVESQPGGFYGQPSAPNMRAALDVAAPISPGAEQKAYEEARSAGKSVQQAEQIAQQTRESSSSTKASPIADTPLNPNIELINSKLGPNGEIIQEYSNGSTRAIDKDGTIVNYNSKGEPVDKSGKQLTGEMYTGAEVKVAQPGSAEPGAPASTDPLQKYTSLLQIGGDPNKIAPIGSNAALFQLGAGGPGGGAAPNLQENRYVPWAGSSSDYGKYDIQASSRTGPGEVYSLMNIAGEGSPTVVKNPDDTLQIVTKTPEEAGFKNLDPKKIEDALSKLTPEQKQEIEKQLPVTKEATPVEKTPEEKKAEQKKTDAGGAAEGEKVDDKAPGGGGGNGTPLASLKTNEARVESVNKENNTAVVVDSEGKMSKVSVYGDLSVGSTVSVKDLSATSDQLAQPVGGKQAGTPTLNEVQNNDGTRTFTYDDSSTLTIDSKGNPVGGTDTDGNAISVPSEPGTTNIPGSGPGEDGGTGGGTGTGNGPGQGPGDGEGNGGGGGGGGGGGSGGGTGTGTGPGKEPGTTPGGKGPGGGTPYKVPVPTTSKGNPINLPGITNLTPGMTSGDTSYELAGRAHFATGGSALTSAGVGGTTMGASPLDKYLAHLTPGTTEGTTNYQLPGYFAKGGEVADHNPEFFSEGGLGSLSNRYVKGKGDGTSDSIPAMLANGEFVIPADVVSSLGNGSNDSGAGLLDEFLKTIRKHKRAADAKHLPPDSKGALGYLLEAKKKVKK